MQRVESIQYLRGIAAISVVAAHSIEYPTHTTGIYITIAGRFGVILFFVVSGFIITLVTGRDKFDPIEFAKKRIVRVVPMYWIVTCVIAVLSFALPSLFKRTTFDLFDFLRSLAFVPYFDPLGGGEVKPMMKLGWTLNYEMLFYLVFGLLFFLNARWRAAGVFLVFFCSYAAGFLWSYDIAAWVFYTDYFTLYFCGGVALGLLYLEGGIDAMTPWHIKFAGSFAIILALLILIVSPSFHHAIRNGLIMLFCVMMALVALAMEAHGWLRKSKLLEKLGDATFSIYLVHIFWVGTAGALGQKFLLVGTWPSYLLIVIIGFVGGVGAGVVTYLLVERPITDYLRRRVGRPRGANGAFLTGQRSAV